MCPAAVPRVVNQLQEQDGGGGGGGGKLSRSRSGAMQRPTSLPWQQREHRSRGRLAFEGLTSD